MGARWDRNVEDLQNQSDTYELVGKLKNSQKNKLRKYKN